MSVIQSEIWECAKCKRWAYRVPVSAQGYDGSKSWECVGCGNTSTQRRGAGRPFGPRSRNWEMLLEWEEFVKAMDGGGDE